MVIDQGHWSQKSGESGDEAKSLIRVYGPIKVEQSEARGMDRSLRPRVEVEESVTGMRQWQAGQRWMGVVDPIRIGRVYQSRVERCYSA
jgi:hypothetical protein